MKFINCLAVIIFLSLISSCSIFSNKESVKEEVFFDDGYKKSADGEVTLEDISFTINERTDTDKTGFGSQTITTKAADGSSVSEMTDSAGNKSQSRCFENHPLIGCIVLKTSVKGSKEVMIYAQNGQVKTLSADKIEDVLTISPDEAAGAAEIFEGRKNNSSPTMFTKKPDNSQPLQPLPSYKFPIQKSLPRQIEANGETPQAAEIIPETKSVETQEQNGEITPDRQNDEPNEN